MARKPDEWMPLHVRKYLGDTMHLNTEQHGAYLLLLMAYWMRGGALPSNDNELAAICRLSRASWMRMRPIIEPYFDTTSGKWVQKRAEEELSRARLLTDAKSEAGKEGARKRWHSNGTAMAKPLAEQSQNQSQIDAPLPKPRQFSKENHGARMARFNEFWLVCPKKTGKGAAEKAWLRALLQAEADVLIAGMRAYAAICANMPDRDRHFIKTPGPWLNEKRWLDEGIADAAPPPTPEEIEAARDRADRLMKRGKYAETYQ